MVKRRSTPAKTAVLELLSKSGKAMSQDAIERSMQRGIDRATIYRVLNRFCEDGELHKIIAEDGKQYFALCTKCDGGENIPNHFHFRCRGCQTLECLPTPVQFSIPSGYQVENVNCVLSGFCQDCVKNKSDLNY